MWFDALLDALVRIGWESLLVWFNWRAPVAGIFRVGISKSVAVDNVAGKLNVVILHGC